jgi:hypothetical protein
LFKIATNGVSLWHFYLSPLFMVASRGLKILYSFLYREYIKPYSPS